MDARKFPPPCSRILGIMEPLKIFSFSHPNKNAPVPVKRKVKVWYHSPTSSPAAIYSMLCIRPNKTACKIIPPTMPVFPHSLLHRNPLYRISSAMPLAIKFSMRAGKTAAAPSPAKALADTEALLSMYARVWGSTSCVKSKL